jgi:acyl carrier protein
MSADIRVVIYETFQEVFREQNPEIESPVLSEESVLLETGLDSLGFAILVVRLEQLLEFDPFVLSDEAYYPRTFGEFVRFYEANRPQ